MPESEERCELSPLARQFRARFLAQLSSVPHVEAFTTRYELAIIPRHPAVGELRVRDDGDELTISLGSHHHWHLPLHGFEALSTDASIQLAADEAIRELREVLEDRTILRITRRAGQVTRSMTYGLGANVAPLAVGETEYVWSGPRA